VIEVLADASHAHCLDPSHGRDGSPPQDGEPGHIDFL
jgi:hypothetical protein